MPHTKSAKKRLRQNEKRRLRNRIAKKIIKTYSKRAVVAAQAGNTEQAEADMRFAMSKLDKAGIRRILHPNTADRRKSKLSRDVRAALAKASLSAKPQTDEEG
jgi:small subunit ribosomal protein S20